MTDDDIRRHIELMRAIDKPTIHLPIATVERLMATGHKVSIGTAKVTNHKTGKVTVSPIAKMPVSRKIGAKAKADRTETRLRANVSKRKGI